MVSDAQMVMILLWLPLCGLVGYVASQRGRSGWAWAAISFLLSPLVGFAVVAVIPVKAKT